MSTSSPSISSDDPPKTSDTEGLAGSSNSDLPNIHDKLQGTLDNRFLDAGSVCSLLLNNKEGLPKIPGGLKENKYFILDNSSNKNKKGSKNSKSSTFSDDCGVWDRDAGTSPISYYFLHDNGDLSTIFKRKTGYCIKQKTPNLPFRQTGVRPLLYQERTDGSLGLNENGKLTYGRQP